MKLNYVHPKLKTPSISEGDGILKFEGSVDKCHLYENCYDFTSIHCETLDADHYNHKYSKTSWLDGIPLDCAIMQKVIASNSAYQLMFDTMGDVTGKTILLLGNGMSIKEFILLEKGAQLYCTDISLEAVLAIRKKFDETDFGRTYGGKIVCQAVDAMHLPYGDNSFDIVYGCAIVHHLSQLEVFFKDVYRVLKPGGKCIFLDDAYSGWWQWSKRTFLRPLQIYSHRKTGISPEDLKATLRGGYKKTELENLLCPIGFRSLIYRRTMFFEHFLRRGSGKLLNKKFSGPMAKWGKILDRTLLSKKSMGNMGMLLVWGAVK
jgi:ubiquinone/menaquinone biosynthesis C-methylase UbiE